MPGDYHVEEIYLGGVLKTFPSCDWLELLERWGKSIALLMAFNGDFVDSAYAIPKSGEIEF